jgi:hypothetical protein
MSEFKLPPPRRMLRFDVPRHDDSLVGLDMLDMGVFDEIARIESSPLDASDLLLVIDELANELTISLTLIAEVDDQVAEVRIAEVA